MGIPYAEVIGDPIAHSKSPLIHLFWLSKLGIAGAYRAVRVRPGALPAYLDRRRRDPDWRGCNVTLPHKVAVRPLLDEERPDAASAGAVNLVTAEGGKLVGRNSDVGGFLEPLQGLDPGVVTLVGAGGAARAVLAALGTRRVAWVSILNRDVEKARALREAFGLEGCAAPLGAEVPTAELLVNASALGMAGKPPLPPVERHVSDSGTVYDLVYAPVETRLLAAARARGQRTIDGLQMLVAQAASAFELFFGKAAPREHDAELRELLVR
ncbi:MAG: shikimate dehydrogenase [Alphaproteobacteria bacterium]|nr:shikimate dehydrogenase [Alphaproteobacteria bacterium]MBV9371758.1 shikimate dehydrogenase [Alphaproteobacteria bacterium]MBV9900702.1 shikimate dehydrogenase [Alphaproteobacteria bacterium]